MKSSIYLVFLFISQMLFSQKPTIETYSISNSNFSDHITEMFYYRITDDKTLTPKNILENQHLFISKYNETIKDSKIDLPKVFWFVGKIKNETKDTLSFVFITSNSQKLDIYQISENDTIKTTVGYFQNIKEAFIYEKPNAINITLNPNQESILLLKQEVYEINELVIKFNIGSLNTFESKLLNEHRFYLKIRLLSSILLGILILLFMHNLFMFFKSKSKSYIYYSLYLIFIFFYIFITLDWNRNFILRSIMLYFPILSVITYCFCIVFYGLFVRSILQLNNSLLKHILNVYYIITGFFFLYLITNFYTNQYNLDLTALTIIKFFGFASLLLIGALIFHLYKERKVKFIRYVFIGSLVLTFFFIIQAYFDYYDRILFEIDFSRLIIRTKFSILLGTVLEILFFSYALYIKNVQVIREKQLLENMNAFKSRFFSNISHEFRTPLTLIKSPLQSLQTEITDQNHKNKLELIEKNATRMLDLVDQILELSKLDNGKLNLIFKEGNIGLFLSSIVEPFSFLAIEKKLLLTSSIEKNSENHYFDKDVIEKIVTNLLSNAIKYTSENETVKFQSMIENNQLQFVVSNSGSEIKKDEINKLFERFYQKTENHQGVGIGLALVKELVESYKGKIETNVENGILSFTVLLPLEKVNADGVIITKKDFSTTTLHEKNKNTELPIVLLVDDNQEIRMILKDILKDNYHILEAEDGEQGLKIAKKEIPDCIISDVMMPKMDGFEFTKQIKNNELTSFIPVVLLTAKTSNEAHLESLKSTADAFLTKPFNNEIIKATVLQLIEERKKLHNRYSQELVLRPVDIVINSVDEQFIQKLQKIIDTEIGNAEFNAENFASAVGMSRMQLHRKLKSLLGVTASEYMRNERLKTAVELLKKGKGNISDIAYAVGFNDVSYFSKCFKEMYHCTPSEYMEK